MILDPDTSKQQLTKLVEELSQQVTALEISLGRLQKEQQTIESQRDNLRKLIEQLPIGVQIFDPSGLCVDVNNALLRILGVGQRDQLIGRHNLLTDKLAEQVGTQAAGYEALAPLPVCSAGVCLFCYAGRFPASVAGGHSIRPAQHGQLGSGRYDHCL